MVPLYGSTGLGKLQTTYELRVVGRIQGCDPPNAGDRPITFGGTRPWFRPTGYGPAWECLRGRSSVGGIEPQER